MGIRWWAASTRGRRVAQPLVRPRRAVWATTKRRSPSTATVHLRPGCQWHQLPEPFGDDSTGHRHFQRWCELGVFEWIWATLVQACEALGGVDWQWQAADAAMGKARMGGDLVGRNPTDRGKKG
jgi:putative transposase